MSRRKGPTPQKRRAWQPLTRRVGSVQASEYAKHGMTPPDQVWANDVYSVFVRLIPTDYRGKPMRDADSALHISFHRHDRAAVRDWRHFQAIKNEVAGPERTAVELFPPESQLADSANEYHLWVLPVGYVFPFALDGGRLVLDQREAEAHLGGKTKARQRDWQPGLPTGKGLSGYDDKAALKR